MNNKTLIIVFGALLLVYLLTKFFSGNRERSFDAQIVQVDTASVTKVIIYPAQGAEKFEMSKTGSGWQLQRGAEQYTAVTTGVSSLLSSLVNIEADRIVSKNPERHKDYAVDDEGGTRIELMNGSKKIGDIIVGRFNFNQATRSGVSYLRKYDEPSVYSVEGFLSMSLAQGFDSYRDKNLTVLNDADLTKLTYQENGTQVVLTRIDSIWKDPGGEAVDSLAMSTYLNSLRSVSGGTFVQSRNDVGENIKSLKIEGNNMIVPVELNCYTSRDTSQHFVIHSSLNEDGYFFSDSNGIYNRVFATFPFPSAEN